MPTKLLAALLLLACGTVCYAQRQQPTDEQPVETDERLHSNGKDWGLEMARVVDPNRPRVLLIGDSILNGYGPHVTKALAGEAYVDLWIHPYYQSEQVNRIVAEVLEKGPYDVIHFNMGLHGWQEGRIKPGTFKPLTREFVMVLKEQQPPAKLIWARSTPVTALNNPAALDEEINPIIVDHNRMADEVMKELEVPVNDFYNLLIEKRELSKGDRFHWKPAGYKLLADSTLVMIREALPKQHGGTSAEEEASGDESTEQQPQEKATRES